MKLGLTNLSNRIAGFDQFMMMIIHQRLSFTIQFPNLYRPDRSAATQKGRKGNLAPINNSFSRCSKSGNDAEPLSAVK